MDHSIFPYDSIRLGSQRILSWVVVWNHWCRTRQIQLSFYMVLTGTQNMRETELDYTLLCSGHPCISLFLIIQLMFRVEIHISVAWGSWFWDMGHWHSWLGFLWFRFVLLLFLFDVHSSPYFFILIMLSFLLFVLLDPSEKLPSCDVVSKREHFYQVLV